MIELKFIILEYLYFSVLRSQLQISIQIVLRSSDQRFPIHIVLHSPLQIFVFLLRIYVFQIISSSSFGFVCSVLQTIFIFVL